jgi:hypothetical protein
MAGDNNKPLWKRPPVRKLYLVVAALCVPAAIIALFSDYGENLYGGVYLVGFWGILCAAGIVAYIASNDDRP